MSFKNVIYQRGIIKKGECSPQRGSNQSNKFEPELFFSDLTGIDYLWNEWLFSVNREESVQISVLTTIDAFYLRKRTIPTWNYTCPWVKLTLNVKNTLYLKKKRFFFFFFLMKSNARRCAPEWCSPYESRKILALLKRRESWSSERVKA